MSGKNSDKKSDKKSDKLEVTIVGGGMIVKDQILPSIYHLQRMGIVSRINICALHVETLKKLADNKELKESFSKQTFTPYPSFDQPSDKTFPDLFKEVIAKMKPDNAVIIALPDHLHYMAIKEALKNNQHVLCVKPLVLKYDQAVEIEKEAWERGLFVGIEYHKRFDKRSLIAKKHYESGDFGEFIIGEAKLIEPYYYRQSNFQNWFTAENTDPFVYVGCHYWDLVQFITGLKPVEVSVRGIKRKFPNGNEGYLWANGRVIYENGAILSITAGLGYPDNAAGSNEQCLSMFFEDTSGKNKTACLKHDDQFRGVEYSFLEGIGPGGSHFNYINPDYFRLVPWDDKGFKPVGYGHDSIEANITAVSKIINETKNLNEWNALVKRKLLIQQLDTYGLIATPFNSKINELVTEAARLSILNNGKSVKIIYEENPFVRLQD